MSRREGECVREATRARGIGLENSFASGALLTTWQHSGYPFREVWAKVIDEGFSYVHQECPMENDRQRRKESSSCQFQLCASLDKTPLLINRIRQRLVIGWKFWKSLHCKPCGASRKFDRTFGRLCSSHQCQTLLDLENRLIRPLYLRQARIELR